MKNILKFIDYLLIKRLYNYRKARAFIRLKYDTDITIDERKNLLMEL